MGMVVKSFQNDAWSSSFGINRGNPTPPSINLTVATPAKRTGEAEAEENKRSRSRSRRKQTKQKAEKTGEPTTRRWSSRSNSISFLQRLYLFVSSFVSGGAPIPFKPQSPKARSRSLKQWRDDLAPLLLS
ncbi:hypothetical protein ACLB2K_017556 [Fragaria x ananassa]